MRNDLSHPSQRHTANRDLRPGVPLLQRSTSCCFLEMRDTGSPDGTSALLSAQIDCNNWTVSSNSSALRPILGRINKAT